MPDKNQAPVAVVTGASRGVGRGVAIALGSHGCTVYITGRSQKTGQTENLPGTIYETAEAVTAAGGMGIAIACDHADDAQTKAVFDQVEREQGRLDILVNNAAKVSDLITEPGGFWEKPLDLVDLLDVGLRSAYVCSYYAAPMMVRQKHGLMIFTGSQGGVCYFMGPAYGAHKAGEDKFAADMGYELKDHGVAAICIWCGGVLTDRLKRILGSAPDAFAGVAEMCETPEFTGHVIWALYDDPKLMERSGQSWIGAELAMEYGIKDEGDRQPPNMREMLGVAPRQQPWPTS
ncbi:MULTISPECIES: SDR family NAD(P)-dependent oxidoreductase [unclassified Mycobacterium]|uniref:SDR family NAD(P)-dependent oxidoreductase n=1 Tax=unclassified Mycobacterium TaxID=2642494 RepID=UPI0029C60C10|nr:MULTISPECIES: SDR family NAD(P)-dependent oxidoreductase [unclassified Mycobacterium]